MQKIISLLFDFFQFDFFFRVFKQYAHFGGRLGRKDFWLFILTSLMIFIGVDKVATTFEMPKLLFVFGVVMFPPVVSAIVRRLHDVGKSGHLIPLCMLLSVVFFFSIGFAFQKDMSMDYLVYLGYGALLIAFYPFLLLLKKSSPHLNKYDTMPSHPYKHGVLAILFVLFFSGVVYLLKYQLDNPPILSESQEPLSQMEIEQIDKVLQKYQKEGN